MTTTADRYTPDRAAGLGLLASALIAMAPYVPRLPWWLSLFIVALATWRYLILRRGWPAPNIWLRFALVAGATLVVFSHYGTVFGRDAGSGLLVTMLALKFLELRRLRDYMLALFLIYLLIAINFLYSQDLWLVIYLGAALLVTSATLIRIAIPGTSGRRTLRLAGFLLLQALPLMIVMYLLFPRIQGSLWGLPRDVAAGQTGLSDHMRPGSINELSRSDEIALRAYFAGEIPKPADRYWRAVVLSWTDGQLWLRDRRSGKSPPERPTGPILQYTMVLEPSGKPWVPVLEYPSRWPAELRWRSAGTLVAETPIHHRRIVEMAATPAQRITIAARNELDSARQLPPLSPRVSALARELAKNRTGSDVAGAILAHFHTSQFYYTLQPPLMTDDPVDQFLFDTRQGFCEHYAAAFVTLMRAAGIPARIVTGYQGGQFNATNRSLIVRQSDAHAWAEYWIGGEGWKRADPTSAVAPERIALGADALRQMLARGLQPGSSGAAHFEPGWLERLGRNTWLALDTVQSAWQRWVLSYGAVRQQQLLEQLGIGSVRGAERIGALALIIALVFGIYILLTRPRRPPVDAVQRQYLRLCRKLKRLGTERRPNEGPVDYLARAGRDHPRSAEELARLGEIYVALRYGNAATGAFALLADLSRGVSALRGQTGRVRPGP